MHDLIRVPTYGLNLGRGYWYPGTSTIILILVGDPLGSKSPGAGLGPAPGNSAFFSGTGILKFIISKLATPEPPWYKRVLGIPRRADLLQKRGSDRFWYAPRKSGRRLEKGVFAPGKYGYLQVHAGRTHSETSDKSSGNRAK